MNPSFRQRLRAREDHERHDGDHAHARRDPGDSPKDRLLHDSPPVVVGGGTTGLEHRPCHGTMSRGRKEWSRATTRACARRGQEVARGESEARTLDPSSFSTLPESSLHVRGVGTLRSWPSRADRVAMPRLRTLVPRRRFARGLFPAMATCRFRPTVCDGDRVTPQDGEGSVIEKHWLTLVEPGSSVCVPALRAGTTVRAGRDVDGRCEQGSLSPSPMLEPKPEDSAL